MGPYHDVLFASKTDCSPTRITLSYLATSYTDTEEESSAHKGETLCTNTLSTLA